MGRFSPYDDTGNQLCPANGMFLVRIVSCSFDSCSIMLSDQVPVFADNGLASRVLQNREGLSDLTKHDANLSKR